VIVSDTGGNFPLYAVGVGMLPRL